MEILDAAAGVDVVDGGADGIDGLVGREELRAVDRVRRGSADPSCRDIGDGALGANGADTHRRGRVDADEVIGSAVDHRAGGADGCRGHRARAQGHIAGTCCRGCAIAQRHIAHKTGGARGGAVAQRHGALPDRLVVVADRDCAGGLVGGGGAGRAVTVGDVVRAAGEGAGAAGIAGIADRHGAVAISDIVRADGDGLAAGRHRTGAHGHRVGGIGRGTVADGDGARRRRIGADAECGTGDPAGAGADAGSERIVSCRFRSRPERGGVLAAGNGRVANCCAGRGTGDGGGAYGDGRLSARGGLDANGNGIVCGRLGTRGCGVSGAEGDGVATGGRASDAGGDRIGAGRVRIVAERDTAGRRGGDDCARSDCNRTAGTQRLRLVAQGGREIP